jgi:cysteine desulfurase/selenocysteine lyase
LCYLDNAATSQTPQVVVDRISRYYLQENANVHRGVHYLSQTATDAYEAARERIQAFLNAPAREEIIYTRGTTEAINLVAHSFARPRLQAGDRIVISALEHHSNIVPWQLICEDAGAELKVIDITDAGELRLDQAAALLTERTRLLTVNHVSNALGTINPVGELCALARERGIPTLIDGAQATPHTVVDVQAIGCDFYAFSGHKVYGPTGIGALWARREHLDAMRPYLGGGVMISSVTFEISTWAEPPNKFVAGTPNICGAIALATALDYVDGIGLDAIGAHEHDLLTYGSEALSAIHGLRIVGTAAQKAGVISFVMDGVHPHDLGTIVDTEGVAIRAGHHCAQPLMRRLGLAATARASFACYNTPADIDRLVVAIQKAADIFG